MFAADIPQTIKQAYQDMRDGGDPWVALGDFSHDWYGNYPEPNQRAALVAEPVELPEEEVSPEQLLPLRQWAACEKLKSKAVADRMRCSRLYHDYLPPLSTWLRLRPQKSR